MAEGFLDHVNKLLVRYKSLQNELASIEDIGGALYVKIAKKIADMDLLVSQSEEYRRLAQERDSLIAMSKEAVEDKDFLEYVLVETQNLTDSLFELENRIKQTLVSKIDESSENAILEVRAGTGGEEAALFATELFLMYQKYASLQKWKFEILSINETDIGGFKEAVALIGSSNAFAKLKFESGVHRVQRVPATETKGRIHTSTATVAVLPEAKETEVVLEDKDLKIETCRSSGAGGQHVNTTDSAVRILHIPTGICVSQSDERSQHKNKARALKILRSRVFELEKNQKDSARASERKSQVGSGERSEKVRTYNFPQGRITDHRINFTAYNIEEVVKEGRLDEIISQLSVDHQAKLFANFDLEKL
jgi:peptide chain release factor 1